MDDIFKTQQWRGITVPSEALSSLPAEQSGDLTDDGLVYRAANTAFRIEPELTEIVDFAKDYHHIEKVIEGKLGDDEIHTYINGLDEGFSFLIGSILVTEAAQQGVFLDIYQPEKVASIVPDFLPGQSERIMDVIAGNYVLDIIWRQQNLGDSENPMSADLRDFLIAHPAYCDVLKETTKNYDDTRLEGFMTGAEIALAVFIQKAEEDLGILLEN